MLKNFSIEQKDNKIIVSSENKTEDTMILNVLINNTIDSSDIVSQCLADDSVDESQFELDKDGFYTIYRIVIPTLKWISDRTDDITEILKYDNIYVIDDNTLYKYYYKTQKLVPIDTEEIIEINSDSKTNIKKEYINFFSYYFLEQCFLDFTNAINAQYIQCYPKKYTNGNCGCGRQEFSSSLLKFRRNTILMFLNLIKYYIKCKNFWEAYKLLDQFNNCYKFCKSNLQYKKSCGCNG